MAKMTLEQKVLALGEAKATVDRLKADFWNALYECPNRGQDDDSPTGISHIEQALDDAKAYREEKHEAYPEERLLAGVISCPTCLKAFNLMEERKVAVRALSNRKGTVLKAALKLYREAVQ